MEAKDIAAPVSGKRCYHSFEAVKDWAVMLSPFAVTLSEAKGLEFAPQGELRENRRAGVSPAVARAFLRSAQDRLCPCAGPGRPRHVRRRAIFMVSGCPSADGHERLP